MTAVTVDPIKLEILSSAYKSVTEECFISLMKSAYSTNIKERKDHSTAIMDADGRLVMQTMVSPIHIASMAASLAAVLEKFGDGRNGGIRPGDLFVGNDPHVAGGTHLPDVNLTSPIFSDGRLIAFAVNIAHHADIGGMAPGSMIGGMTEIYQEGLRIPCIKLFREGEMQQGIMDLLLLNARLPNERRGDYFAQIAACRLGVRRVEEIVGVHGTDTVVASFDELIRRTHARMHDSIKTVKDGTTSFQDVMDDDGRDTFDIPIKVSVTIDGPKIAFDFTGTAQQVEGNVNVTMNATVASVCYAVQALLDPYMTNNQGVLDAIDIHAPEGSLLNAVFPAAVASRAHTCQRIVDVVIGALAPLMPDRAVAASNGANTMAVFSGNDPRTGEGYVYLETIGGGMGARSDKDGKDCVQVHITNTSNLPVEAIEMEYPLLIEEYGLVPDSGGAGTFRGGCGIRRVVRPVGHEFTFSGVGERFRHQPWGIFDGQDGKTGRFVLLAGDGDETALPGKPSNVRVGPDTSVILESPGAGGYGSPVGRSAENVAQDRRSEKFSDAYLSVYGDSD